MRVITLFQEKLNIEEEDRRLDHQSHRYISQCGTLTTGSSDDVSIMFLRAFSCCNQHTVHFEDEACASTTLWHGEARMNWTSKPRTLKKKLKTSWGSVKIRHIWNDIFICALLIMSSLMFVSLSLNLTSLSFSTHTTNKGNNKHTQKPSLYYFILETIFPKVGIVLIVNSPS